MAEKGGGTITRMLASACVCLALFACIFSQMPGPASAPTHPVAPGAVGHAPAGVLDLLGSVFARNEGQVDDSSILYYSTAGSAAFGRSFIMLYTSVGNGSARSALRYSFVGANDVSPVGEAEVTWKSSYFYGSEPAGWRTGVSNYNAVLYPDLWDGIDLRCTMRGGGLKYEFTVGPSADHNAIRFRVEGHEGLSLTAEGTLCVATGLGTDIIDSGLDVSYRGGERVPAAFDIISQDTYGFSIPGRDMSRAIIIDPLITSTYLGGSGDDAAVSVAIDQSGCVYVAGDTTSIDFPTTLGAYQTKLNYAQDMFVAKLSPTGGELLFSTYIGDNAEDRCTSMAVDGEGRVCLTGYTGSFRFPTTQNAFSRVYGGDTYDGFVLRLGQYGDRLEYSTFLGAERTDQCFDITLDSEGYAYLTGSTWSWFFPTTPGSLRWSSGLSDIIVAKMDLTSGEMIYSAMFGTQDYDEAYGIAVDKWGYAYITGSTRSEDLVTSTSAFDRSNGGNLDAFAIKISPNGETMAYSTYLGGAEGDVGRDIAVGEWGHAYITGYTYSIDFPVTPGSHDTTHNGWTDAFVTALGRFGESLVYSTFLGGAGGEQGRSICLDSIGNAFVAGLTESENMPLSPGTLDATYNGNGDAFVAKYGATGGRLAYCTYLGGNGTDVGTGIALSPTDYAFVIGTTGSPDFPTTQLALDTTPEGGTDVFITMMDLADPVPRVGPDRQADEDSPVVFDGSGSTDNEGIVNHTWTFNDGAGNRTVYAALFTHTFAVPGVYAVTLNVTDAACNWAVATMNLMVLDITNPNASAGSDIVTDEDLPVIFNGSASADNVAIVNFTWNFAHAGKTVELYGATPTFTFTTPGTYQVKLTVRDGAGNGATDDILVTVNDTTAPVAQAGPDMRVYRGAVVAFNGTASTDNLAIAAYTWTFDEGATAVALQGSRPSRLFPSEGVFEITLAVTDAAGNRGTDTMVLSVLETVRPVAEAGPDMIVDEMSPMSFDGSACTDNIGIARWAWTFTEGGNTATLFGTSPTWTFTVPGTYEVGLNASDAAGNWAEDSLTVTVLDVEDPDAVTGPNRVAAPGEVVELDGSGSVDSSGISRYTWTFAHNGTQVTLDGPAQSFTFWSPGSYEVTLTVEDATGKTGTGTMTVTVMPETAGGTGTGGGAVGPMAATCLMLALLAAVIFRMRGKGVAGR